MLYKIYSKIKRLIWQALNRPKDECKGVCVMSGQQGKNNGAIIIGALVLGFLLLKSIVNSKTQIHFLLEILNLTNPTRIFRVCITNPIP